MIAAQWPERKKAVRTDMEEKSINTEAKDVRYGQDHERWRAEHAEALAILRSAEAQILAHEAQMLAHEAELGGHPAPTDSSMMDISASGRSDASFAEAHEAAAPHHHDLLRAIRALKPYLNGRPQT